MAPFEERLSAVEQIVAALRQDFLKAIVDNTHSMGTLNRVITQQEQNLRDADHEITILLGVVSAQGKDIKAIKNHLEGFDQRFESVDRRLEGFDQRFESVDRRLEGFDQRFTSVEDKLDQILLMLDRLTPKAE